MDWIIPTALTNKTLPRYILAHICLGTVDNRNFKTKA